MRDVLRAAGLVAEAERRQHPPFRNIEPIALPVFACQSGRNLGRPPVQPERGESEQVEGRQKSLQFELTAGTGSLDSCRRDYPSEVAVLWPEQRKAHGAGQDTVR